MDHLWVFRYIVYLRCIEFFSHLRWKGLEKNYQLKYLFNDSLQRFFSPFCSDQTQADASHEKNVKPKCKMLVNKH